MIEGGTRKHTRCSRTRRRDRRSSATATHARAGRCARSRAQSALRPRSSRSPGSSASTPRPGRRRVGARPCYRRHQATLMSCASYSRQRARRGGGGRVYARARRRGERRTGRAPRPALTCLSPARGPRPAPAHTGPRCGCAVRHRRDVFFSPRRRRQARRPNLRALAAGSPSEPSARRPCALLRPLASRRRPHWRLCKPRGTIFRVVFLRHVVLGRAVAIIAPPHRLRLRLAGDTPTGQVSDHQSCRASRPRSSSSGGLYSLPAVL
jgi:hypothetical protein